MWELRYVEQDFSIQAKIAKGIPLPDWVEDEPTIYRDDEFYISAFYDLHTTRHNSQVIEPIPWNIIVQFADRAGLDEEVSNAFIRIIREMDNAYIKWYMEKEKKNYDRLQHTSKGRSNSGSKRR